MIEFVIEAAARLIGAGRGVRRSLGRSQRPVFVIRVAIRGGRAELTRDARDRGLATLPARLAGG
jgi:hypothetical protein